MLDNEPFSLDAPGKLIEFTFYRGRVGLFAILRALGIGNGDLVAIQAYTCVAVPEAILTSGAQPLYIDVEPNGFNMDATDLRRKLTPAVRALVIQHTFGVPADLEPLLDICLSSGIPVIEDCCHTFASSYDGRLVGSFGIGSFYSYEWGKPLVVGMGGSAIVDDSILSRMRENYAMLREPPVMNTVRIQLQYAAFSLLYRPSFFWYVRKLFRLTTKLGLSEGNFHEHESKPTNDYQYRLARPLKRRLKKKLAGLGEYVQNSKKVVAEYRNAIGNQDIMHPAVSSRKEVVFARYPLFVKSKAGLIDKARSSRVEISDWYTSPVHPVKKDDWAKVGYKAGSCPHAEMAAKNIVHLPTHMRVTKSDIELTAAIFADQ